MTARIAETLVRIIVPIILGVISLSACQHIIPVPATKNTPIASATECDSRLSKLSGQNILFDPSTKVRLAYGYIHIDELNQAKAKLGECYGVGVWGERAAQTYEAIVQEIAKSRQRDLDYKQELADRLASARNLESSRQQWQAQFQTVLTKLLPEAEIAITKLSTVEADGKKSTIFEVRVTNRNSGMILRPRNSEIYGYDADSPNVGGRLPLGANLTDSFRNNFKLSSVMPEFIGPGIDEKGIRPGETVTFLFTFGDVPVPNSTYVLFSLESRAVGQRAPVAFRLPADALFSSPFVKP